MNIGLIVICTNKYNLFLQQLLDGARKYFFPDQKVSFFVFTDQVPTAQENYAYTIIPSYGFPEATLYRYKIITDNKDLFKSQDYLFYCDVDMKFVAPVDFDPWDGCLFATLHPGFYAGGGAWCTDVRSNAFLPEELRKSYYAGGFQGGRSKDYLRAASILASSIQDDEEKGIMAEWHDESHWNKYIATVDQSITPVLKLTPEYCYEENPTTAKEYKIDHLQPRLIAIDKSVVPFMRRTRFSYSQLGQHGRLGNQLFQIAATIALAKDHGVNYIFPHWAHNSLLKNKLPWEGSIRYDYQVNEPRFSYTGMVLDPGRNVDITGYFQSEKNFGAYAELIREQFTFREDWIKHVRTKMPASPADGQLCAVHIRRGDYVNNKNYAQLGEDYYQLAMEEMILLVGDNVKFLFFSDDIAWVKQRYSGENIYYAEGQPELVDLTRMTLCDHFIIANSSFSWWGAWLGEKQHTRVIAPHIWFGPGLLPTNNPKDIIPDRWLRPPFKRRSKIDLKDITFTIPVKYDCEERRQNVDLCIGYLLYHFDTNIILAEWHKPEERMFGAIEGVRYIHYETTREFHRTRMLNDMARMAETPIVANWDADIFISPGQILKAVEQLRNGQADGVYPYDGRFFRLSREDYPVLADKLEVSIFNGRPFPRYQFEQVSYGGAVLWKKDRFFAGGGENENFIHYGPEDYERYERFTKLGFKVERVKGPLFHLDHPIDNNGSTGHEYLIHNRTLIEKYRQMHKEDLRKEVSGWKWAHGQKLTVIEAEQIRHVKPEIKRPSGSNPLLSLELDQIYCVNLKRRPDRRAHAEEQFKLAGIENVTFWKARDGEKENLSHKHLTKGMVGCFLSHRDILKYSISHGFNCVLHTEDDLEFAPAAKYILNMALKCLPEDWEFIYLGYSEYKGFGTYKEKVNDFWVKPNSVWGTQAFAIRGQETMKKVYDGLKEVRHQIDVQLTHFVLQNIKTYCILPSVVKQAFEKAGSDVQEHGGKVHYK